jgi:hypothetical protein
MGEIKSAWQKAMERVEKLGQSSPEELEKFKYVPLGRAIAARYLREENFHLDTELDGYKESSSRKYIVQGIEQVLMQNIFLPKNEEDRKTSKKAMVGIKTIKKDLKKTEAILAQLDTLLGYYEQARQQAFTQLKESFTARLQNMANSLEQQTGTKVSINPELQPQFQEMWLRTRSQMDAQYEKALREQKEHLSLIS